MTDSQVDEYVAGAPEPQRTTLRALRTTLQALLPDASESLSYGVPAFKVGEKAIAGYAQFKQHCSYFPHSGSVLPQLAEELDGYAWSKGTLKFPIDEPLSPDLVRLLVRARLDELGLEL